MKNSPFSATSVAVLLASALALFAMSVLLRAYDNDPVSTGGKAKPGSYSTSAIGYAGFYDTMRRLERPVIRSVGNTLALVGTQGTLIVAEPDLSRLSATDAQKLIAAPRLLLVLPKWRGEADPGRPSWLVKAEPAPLHLAGQTLALVSGRSTVYRAAWPEAWSYNQLGITPVNPQSARRPEQTAEAGEAGLRPEDTIQLIRSQELRPIVGTGSGMLVGEMIHNGKRIWVLSDPDVMSNHGLRHGGNAAFMLALLDTLAAWKNPNPAAHIVFDETVHGFEAAQGSPIKLLFRFPFVVVTLLIAVSAALLALAATSRFGAPERSKAELDFGKAKLIDNSARLLDYAGQHKSVLNRYIRMTVRQAGHALHAPPGLSERALAAWLDRIGKARGLKLSCTEILQHTADINNTAGTGKRDATSGQLAGLFENAGKIHRWKGELLNGSATNRHHS